MIVTIAFAHAMRGTCHRFRLKAAQRMPYSYWSRRHHTRWLPQGNTRNTEWLIAQKIDVSALRARKKSEGGTSTPGAVFCTEYPKGASNSSTASVLLPGQVQNVPRNQVKLTFSPETLATCSGRSTQASKAPPVEAKNQSLLLASTPDTTRTSPESAPPQRATPE